MKSKTYIMGIILYLFAQIGDVTSTLIALNFCGSIEANLIVNYFLGQGLFLAVLYKLFSVAAVLVIIHITYKRDKELGIAGIFLLAGFVLAVVLNNIIPCFIG